MRRNTGTFANPVDGLLDAVTAYHTELCEQNAATESSAQLVRETRRLRENGNEHQFRVVIALMDSSGFLEAVNKDHGGTKYGSKRSYDSTINGP